jgi:hypothetical protein
LVVYTLVGMDTISVRCNSCGAPLETGAQARFVTCKFCNSQLEIKRTDSSIFTQEISRIAQRTEQMADNLEAIKLQNEIEMLDREAARSLISATPQKAGGRAGGALGLGFSIFFVIVAIMMAAMAASHGAPALFPLVFVGIGIFGLLAGIMGFAKSCSVSGQQNNLQQRRDELIQKLEALKNPQEPPIR